MNVLKPVVIGLVLFSISACYRPVSNRPTPSSESNFVAAPTPAASSVPSHSTSADVDYAKAFEAYSGGKFEDAVKGFHGVIKAEPKNFDAHFYLGKSYEALARSDEAMKAYSSAIAISTDHVGANLSAGLIEHKRANYLAAQPFLEKAAKIDYKSTKALMALGDNQRALKMFDRAIVQYGKVIGFDANNAEAYYGMGLTYIGLNNKIGARQQLRKLEPLNKELAKKLSDRIGS